MNFNTLWQHLSDPEYVHVLINPLPVYGLAIGILALVLALVLRTPKVTMAALVLVFVSGLSAWPTYHYGEAGYDRVKALSDDAGVKWLDEHMARGEKLIWAFYVLAGVSAIGVVAVAKWPRSSFAISVLTLVLGTTTLGFGGYIAYAGGHVRHREFRFEPPPEAKADEHHHHGEEAEHPEEQKAATSPAQPMDHAEHEQMQKPAMSPTPAMEHAEHDQMQKPSGEKPATEEELKQLEASRLQLEASKLQLEASRKQLEATTTASPSAKPGASLSPSPSASEHKHDEHPH